jgi:hypothetical protein
LVLNQHVLDGAVSLNSALKLTYGTPQGFWWMASHFDPSQSILTRLYQDEVGSETICQLRLSAQDQLAYLSFIGGNEQIEEADLASILSDLGQSTQKLGAMHMVAEVDHKQPLLEMMKSSGFGVSAWQDIWKLNQQASFTDNLEQKAEWCPLAEVDWWQAVQLLQSIIPPISQITDLPHRHHSRFWVCHRSESIIAFADVRHGPRGIWLQPTFAPEVSRVPDLLCDLVNELPARLSRPVFLSVRSYQSWLFRSIEQMNVEYIGHQAILVKHLVGFVKEFSHAELLRLDKHKVKPSHSVIPSRPVK